MTRYLSWRGVWDFLLIRRCKLSNCLGKKVAEWVRIPETEKINEEFESFGWLYGPVYVVHYWNRTVVPLVEEIHGSNVRRNQSGTRWLRIERFLQLIDWLIVNIYSSRIKEMKLNCRRRRRKGWPWHWFGGWDVEVAPASNLKALWRQAFFFNLPWWWVFLQIYREIEERVVISESDSDSDSAEMAS